jgi:hypothetical protein
MKALLACAVLMVLGATALAKPSPIENQTKSSLVEDSAISIGPAAAALESDYFRPPQTPVAAGRIFPCRLQLRLFEKTQIAQFCR